MTIILTSHYDFIYANVDRKMTLLNFFNEYLDTFYLGFGKDHLKCLFHIGNSNMKFSVRNTYLYSYGYPLEEFLEDDRFELNKDYMMVMQNDTLNGKKYTYSNIHGEQYLLTPSAFKRFLLLTENDIYAEYISTLETVNELYNQYQMIICK